MDKRMNPFEWIDRIMRRAILILACVMLALMVIFTAYTVVMRYVFQNAPFWGDTLSVFCNIWLVLLAYGLTVRDRDDIAMQGIYARISPRLVIVLDMLWTMMTLVFGIFLARYGFEAAMKVPGMFWELGGLPKKYPMMIMPIAGVLVALAALVNTIEDVWSLRNKYRES